MNDKFQRLRGEVLETFGTRGASAVQPDLVVVPPDEQARGDLQVRLYSLWERLKHFRDDQLEAAELADRDAFTAQVERSLSNLHKG